MTSQPTIESRSKLELSDARVAVQSDIAAARLTAILERLDVYPAIAREVAEHLVDANLSGVESHGVMRILQYADQYRAGHLRARAQPVFQTMETGAHEVDGQGGIGIPAMRLAYDESCRIAETNGMSAIAIRNVGHTGRHGFFADQAAQKGFLTIMTGGGNRQQWRQVAPYGGIKAMLPTNPWCMGAPGGAQGSNVLDFATSKIAGGWIYAARSAGALLPEGCVIDRLGNPTRDPEDYFNGGAILPSGEHKGFALALMSELIGEAMLGPVTLECHWLLVCIDTRRFRASQPMQEAAEDILAELRDCPPAPGFARVEIPGERERAQRVEAHESLAVPARTWKQIETLAASLGA
ncbi:MAG: Ldh family oxidoreductase [Rhodobacteraceae bacterium]|nr:Ldh family oxidoreductase [Paracoccaceae bacterium]